MDLLFNILARAFSVFIAAYVVPGISVENFFTAIVVAIVLGLVNMFIKPLLVLLTLPVTIFTLGIFLLVINAALVMLVSAIVPGFLVSGFWAALLFSIIVSLVGSLLNSWKRS